jgi:sulfide:quinone oxidoreductase
MSRPHCIVLGGGFGGLAAAHRLRQRLGERADVTLIDRRGTFMLGLRILWTLVGQATRAEGTRSHEVLAAKGIRYLRDEAVRLDLDRRQVVTRGGTLGYEALVVAIGAELRPDLIPGYDPEGSSLYDPDQAERIAVRLSALDRGRIGIGILGVPYKCPPAPYEAAFLVDDLLRRRGVRDRIEIEVFTPMLRSLPVAGPEMCRMVEEMLAAQAIHFLPGRRVTAVEGPDVVFEQERRTYDLFIGIAPHRAPAVVRESGLTSGEWIRPDPRTCATAWPGVYAVGDVTEMPLANGMMLPKAGVFAEAQGQVAAEHIAQMLGAGSTTEVFDGAGFCYMETGGGMAAEVRGQFFAEPAPAVTPVSPSARSLADKRAFEASRLAAWF